MDRRDFIRLMSLISGGAVISSCGVNRGEEKLIPYLVPPEEGVIPHEARYFKTACTECPAGCGVSARVVDGHPVKLEGLKGHPVNDGTLCVRGQASLSRLYHPERVRGPLVKDGGTFKPVSWADVFSLIGDKAKKSVGKQSFFLSGRTTGTLRNLHDEFCTGLKIERLPYFELISHTSLREANYLLFSFKEVPLYRIRDADLLISIGADLIESFVSPVSFAMQIRRARDRGNFQWMHIEPHVSLTGLQADRRFVITSRSEAYLLTYLIHSLKENAEKKLPDEVFSALPQVSAEKAAEICGLSMEEVLLLSGRLAKAKAPLLVLGGASAAQENGLEVSILAVLIQWMTCQIGSQVDFSESEVYEDVGNLNNIKEVVARINEDETGLMMLVRADPLGSLGSSLGLSMAVDKVDFKVCLTELITPTANACDVILPLSHPLESWGDVISRRGIRTLLQPTLEPLFRSLSEGDILLRIMNGLLAGPKAQTFQEYLFKAWAHERKNMGERLISNGYAYYEAKPKEVEIEASKVPDFLSKMDPTPPNRGDSHIILVPSIRKFDGRGEPLAMLSEIPDPLTTVSYGRWISVSDTWAIQHKLEDKDEIEFMMKGQKIKLPIKVQPRLSKDVFLAYFDAVPSPFFGVDDRSGEGIAIHTPFEASITGTRAAIPILSGSLSQEGRGLIPHPEAMEKKHKRYSFYPEQEYESYHWTMVIDLDRCTGCSACVAACYIENNVPVVGKREHLKGRELSWLRIEPYYEEFGVYFLPMMCQQCDNAPCEPVCPVYATYHSPEGINAQIYNRCVGTRYCSNNCPYKVRRFNWFEHKWKDPLNNMLNPDISVREKGVMEKCTFCIQRIRASKDRAKDEDRLVRDGEVIPACAQTCPTGAIHFGNFLDENSTVYKLAHSEKAYRVFENLGTESSVYYLRKKEGQATQKVQRDL